jgi:protein TonB
VNPAAAARENAGGRIGRPAVIVSIVLHALFFLCAVGLPRMLSSGASGNKVYVVDLVTLPGNSAPAAPAPAAATPEPPKPAPVKPPEVKKAPEVKKEAVKKAPPKPIPIPEKNTAPKKETLKTPPPKEEPKPVPVPEKEKEDAKGNDEETAEETAAATPSTATQPSGTSSRPAGVPTPGTTGTGAGGTGTGAGSGDEYDFYIAMLKKRIEAAWKRPVSTSREVRTAAVSFELSPTGRLLKLELRNPSGYVPFDRSIMQAVKDAEPFPPFPLALKLDRLAPTLEFELTPLPGGESPP